MWDYSPKDVKHESIEPKLVDKEEPEEQIAALPGFKTEPLGRETLPRDLYRSDDFELEIIDSPNNEITVLFQSEKYGVDNVGICFVMESEVKKAITDSFGRAIIKNIPIGA